MTSTKVTALVAAGALASHRMLVVRVDHAHSYDPAEFTVTITRAP